MVSTIKFSQFASAGDIANGATTVGLDGTLTINSRFNNPWTFLPSGTTAQRPAPSVAINYRLRLNTDTQNYEFYDAVLGMWVVLQDTTSSLDPYIVYKAAPDLPNAQNLGLLTNGILKQTVLGASSTVAIGINGTDYYGPGFVIPGTDGGTGHNNGALTINLGSATTGYVLTSDVSGNATWQAVGSSGAITTIDGDSGSATPSAGVITISGSTTGLTFTGASHTLSLGGVLTGANGGTGHANTGLTINLGSGASGYLLTSDVSGNATWAAPGYLTGAVLLNPSADQSIIAHNLFLTNGTFISGSITGPQGALGGGNIQAVAPGGLGSFIAASYINTSGSAPTYWTYKSRSTSVGSFVTVQTGDTLGRILFYADDGTSFVQSGSIVSTAEGTVSTGIVPSRISFSTANSSGVVTVALKIDSSQLTTVDSLFSNTTIQANTGLISGTSTGGANGSLMLYPITTSSGSVEFVTVNNGGNYANVLTHAATSAARTWTLPDATGTIALTSSASGIVNSGTAGQLAYYAGTGTTVSGTNAGTGVITALGQNVNGSGAISLSTSPTFVTPTLGAALATSINFGDTSLNYYKESTFTPTFTFGTPGDLSVVYTNQTGTYTRIGRLVFIFLRIDCTPTFTTSSGTLEFAGLPFTAGQNSAGSMYNNNGAFTWGTGITMVVPAVDSGSAFAYLNAFKSATSNSIIAASNVTSGVAFRIMLTMTYTV